MAPRFFIPLLVSLFLAACAPQKQAPVELKGDQFYGFKPSSEEEKTSITHIVKSGEFISLLAKRYHVSVSTIASANQLHSPYVIRVGQRLQIPNQTAVANNKLYNAPKVVDQNTYSAVPVATVISSSPVPAKTGAAKEIPPTEGKKVTIIKQDSVVAASPAPASVPTASTAAAPIAPTVPAASISTSTQYSWPVKGEILLHFGPGKGGYFNDGINIAAPENTPIIASDAGTVVYAGNELRGYGNLIIIRHKDGWLTAYAHQKDMVVQKGANVTKGQVIGHVGTSGNVKVPQLHFGIRDGKTALDPEAYLPKL